MDIKIALSIILQRRPWIIREMTHKNYQKADLARAELVKEVMAIAARYEIREIERKTDWPTTP